MPLQTDAPTGIGTEQDWQIGAGASKVEAVRTNDGDTSFLYAYSGGRVNSILFTFPTIIGAVSPVTAATLGLWARKHINGSGGQSLFFKWNGAVVGSNQWASLPTDYSYIGLPYNAGTPTVAEANGPHGFYMSAAGGPAGGTEIWTTMFSRAVSFDLDAIDSTGFNFLVGSIMASIGANLLMRDMGGVLKALRRKGLQIYPHEVKETFRRLRGMTFPRHFVLVKGVVNG